MYFDEIFRGRYQIHCFVFLQIMHEVCTYDFLFCFIKNAASILELLSIWKCIAALCILAYGISGDAIDEYSRFSNFTAIKVMKQHSVKIRSCFEDTYLRQPTYENVICFINVSEESRFLGMFESNDYMYWS